MKFALRATMALLMLSGYAFGQATNGTVTLTPFKGWTAFVPGAAIAATGKNWHQGTQGYPDPIGLSYRYEVTIQPGNLPCLVAQVEPNRLWFFIRRDGPANMTSVTISLRDPYAPVAGGGSIIWSEVIPLTVTATAPVLRGEGQWYSFRDPRLHSFSGGVLELPSNVGLFDISLWVSNLGNIQYWVVLVQGNGIVPFELLADAELPSQVRPENIQFQLPRLAVGTYTLQIYPLIDPGIISNSVTLQIQ